MAYCNCPNCYEVYEEGKPNLCSKCGFPFKGDNENDKEYVRLYALFSQKSTEELKEIINSEEDYTNVAKRVAGDIIETGRMDYHEQIRKSKEEHQRQDAIKQEKYQNLLTNPLYDDIHQIAQDLRFIKNVIIVGLLCGVIMGIVVFFSVL